MNNTLFNETEEVEIKKMGSFLNKNFPQLGKAYRLVSRNERQTVLKEIQTEMEKEGPVNVKLLAIRLSHVPTNDLYFMLSEGRDYRNRGKGEFGKYIYGSIKIKQQLKK